VPTAFYVGSLLRCTPCGSEAANRLFRIDIVSFNRSFRRILAANQTVPFGRKNKVFRLGVWEPGTPNLECLQCRLREWNQSPAAFFSLALSDLNATIDQIDFIPLQQSQLFIPQSGVDRQRHSGIAGRRYFNLMRPDQHEVKFLRLQNPRICERNPNSPIFAMAA
jgi:hypothetical protein